MTGVRGMEQLLVGTIRNYLPAKLAQVTAAAAGKRNNYAGAIVRSPNRIASNAVLSPQRLATLSPSDQQLIQGARQWNAMQQALAHEALANASNRFAAIQSLISAIGTTSGSKGDS